MRMRLRERRTSTTKGISLLSSPAVPRAEPIIGGRPEMPRFGETNLCRPSRDSFPPAIGRLHTDHRRRGNRRKNRRFD